MNRAPRIQDSIQIKENLTYAWRIYKHGPARTISNVYSGEYNMPAAVFFDLGNTLIAEINGQWQPYSDALGTLKALQDRGYRFGLLSDWPAVPLSIKYMHPWRDSAGKNYL